MVPPSEADRAQGDALCDDLRLRIEGIDGQIAKLRAELSKYLVAGRTPRVRRIQGALRSLTVERRQLIDLLMAVGHSYPCTHRREQP